MDEVPQETTRYDARAERQSLRRGRERGVWVFVPAAELRKIGVDPHGPAPRYRLWAGSKGRRVLVNFR